MDDSLDAVTHTQTHTHTRTVAVKWHASDGGKIDFTHQCTDADALARVYRMGEFECVCVCVRVYIEFEAAALEERW